MTVIPTHVDLESSASPPAGGGLCPPAPPTGVPPASLALRGTLLVPRSASDAGGTPVGVEGAKPPAAGGDADELAPTWVGMTHFDAEGRAAMVDVSAKPVTVRTATAGARVVMRPETLAMIAAGTAAKGDVLGVARLAGIMAAKRTSDLIPLCHPLPIDAVALELTPRDDGIDIEATVRTTGRTGVEMEALTAASVAALTIYDMCKSIDRGMQVQSIRLMHKSGGKSGEFRQK